MLEVLVSLFVFAILVAALSGVYTGFLGAQLYTKRTQQNLEGAQLALNSLAKTLRTSKIVVPATQLSYAVSSIRIFDYSRESSSGACLEYYISGEKLYFKSATLTEDNCTVAANLGTAMSLVDGRVFGGFIVDLNDGSKAGKVTISLQLCPKGTSASICNASTDNSTKIQTSVSLRLGN